MLTQEEIKVRGYLIDFVRSHSKDNPYTFYQRLCDKCSLNLNMYNNPADRGRIGIILGNISIFEYKNNRPLISSVVVSQNYEQGDGFYKLCEELGFGNWKKIKEDRADFEMTRECYDFWHKEENFIKFSRID